MSDPGCRTYRELLGVYVVGAIEPAERSMVDAHLNQCHDCREELAGLAVLPALLHRVPLAEAERLTALGQDGDGPDGPLPDLLPSLLTAVRAKRRARRLRAALALAAAVLIAVGGGVAVSRALAPGTSGPSTPAPAHHFDVATASSGRVAVTVHYGQSHWGTAMWVRVTGLPQWTACKFYVVTKTGTRELSGGWIVGTGGDGLWYPLQTSIPQASVAGFVLTSGHRTVQIPAS